MNAKTSLGRARSGSGFTRRWVVVCAICLSVTTSAAQVAHASTFDERTVEDLARSSSIVVVGRVIDTVVAPRGPNGQPGIHTRATIEVARVLRGARRSRLEVWLHGGRLGTRLRWLPGQARLEPGERVLLFLFEAGGALWPSGMARGKWTPAGGGWAPSAPLGPRSEAYPEVALARLVSEVAR